MSEREKTIINFIDQGMVSGVNFITGLLLARYLGVEGYGQFVLVNAIVLFFSGIQIALVVSSMMVKAPSLDNNERAIYLNSVVVVNLQFVFIAAVILFILFLVFNYIYPNNSFSDLIVPLIIFAITFLLQDFIRRYLIVCNKQKSALIIDIITYIARVIMLFVLALNNILTVSISLWVLALTCFLSVIFAIYKHSIYISRPIIKNNTIVIMSTWHSHWEFGKWLVAKDIAFWVSSQLPMYIAAILLSVSSVGIIAAARNIVGILNILFLSMENFVPLRSAKIYCTYGISGLLDYLKRVNLYGGLITFSIVIIAALAPEFWLKLFYGEQFRGFGWVIYYWCIYNSIVFFQRPLTVGIRVIDRTKDIYISNIIGMVISILIAYPMITVSNISGVLLTLIIVQLVVLVCQYLLFKSKLITLK